MSDVALFLLLILHSYQILFPFISHDRKNMLYLRAIFAHF